MRRRRNRLLLVDDEPNVLSALTRTLRREPYEIVATASAQHALNLLRGEDFDLIIADYLMPEMKGLEFLRKVRNIQPDAMRIMLTGHADLEIVIAAINDGAIFRFLTKPWDTGELRVTLRLCMQRQELARQNRDLLNHIASICAVCDFVEALPQEVKATPTGVDCKS